MQLWAMEILLKWIFPEDFPVMCGDVFLMCSDGLWEYIEEHEMESMLNSTSSASAWLSVLEKQVLVKGHPTQDNYSAIVVWCKDSDDDKTLMPGEWN
ncbi:MAG: hypothetical protein IPO71_10540 [Nitrosomonas sp.]|nr:hypothetical protein [Nitrosomonas sp.]